MRSLSFLHNLAALALLCLALTPQALATQNLNTEYDKLSTTCQKLLKSYASSSSNIGSCTGVGDLAVSIFGQSDSGGGDDETSILSVLSGWMSTTCAAPKCSTEVVKKAEVAIGTDCADDLQKGYYLPLMSQAILKHYTTARTILCSHADSSKKYCADQVVTKMESSAGSTFTVSYFSAMLVQPQAFINSLKGTSWCSKCLNSAVTKAKPIIKEVKPAAVTDLNKSLDDKCGAKYTAGATPSGISDASGDDALDFDAATRQPVELRLCFWLSFIAFAMLVA